MNSKFHSGSRPVWLLICGIILISATMRAPLTSVGPLVGAIRDQLHLSNAMAGSITTLPLIAFALFSPFAPGLARRFGMRPVLFFAILVLGAGILLRSASGSVSLFMGTALLGVAIAVCNVLMPALVKREFPGRIGSVTGIYSVSMNLFGAIGSGISIPIAVFWGWQGALGVWSALCLAALFLWLPLVRGRGAEAAVEARRGGTQSGLLRSPLAWEVTLFMGLQSLTFYVAIAWLPEILAERGIPADRAGLLLSVMQLSQLPFTFIVPVIAGRMSHQRWLATAGSLLLLIAFLGLLYGGTQWILLWMIIFGIGGGGTFSLAMMFFNLRTESSQQAAELSGMAQSFGYLLAAVGPALFGYIHDVTHSWHIPLLLMVAVSVALFFCGLGAGSNRLVGAAARRTEIAAS